MAPQGSAETANNEGAGPSPAAGGAGAETGIFIAKVKGAPSQFSFVLHVELGDGSPVFPFLQEKTKPRLTLHNSHR